MSGTDMLREAMKLHPDARRVLLTAYADTDVAISGLRNCSPGTAEREMSAPGPL